MLFACGCHRIVELEPPESTPTCEPDVGFYDSFDGNVPCPWGVAVEEGANVSIELGRLRVSPAPDRDETSFGGCLTSDAVSVGPGGIIIAMTPALDPRTTYLVLHAYPVDESLPRVTLHQQSGKLNLFKAGGETTPPVDYDADKMRWLRLRPDHEAGSTIAESSTDGTFWSRIGVAEDAALTDVYLNFGAGTWTSDSDPGSVAFEHVQVCPP